MALFDVWYTAIIVLDANILLSLYRVAPEKSRKFLEILEALSHRIWIPRQFWEEYRRRRPEMRADISREYKQTQANLQSSRDKSKNSLLHLTKRYSFDSAQHILEIDAFFDGLIGTVHSSSKEYLSRAEFDEVDERIANLCVGRVGDLLPDSTIADIPSMWQWRLDRGIPPGLKDRKKRKPNRYGDLMGWLQIKRHAIGRDRPVIMVTDDTKANDWFVLKNSNPSGPHPDLSRELYDEAGVQLYLYTSEQFMWNADKYLKWQRHVAASGDYFRRLTPTLLPDFGKVAAFESLPVLTAIGSIFGDRVHSLSAMAGFTAGVSNEGLLGLLEGINTFDDRLGSLYDSISSITAFYDNYKPYAELQRSTAEIMNPIREQQRMIADIVDPIREPERTIAEIMNPIREQQRMIAEIMNPIREQQRMIADIVNPIREPERTIAEIMNPIREQQRMIADIVNPIREQQRMIADIVNPIREQQRMIAEIMNPIREQQRMIADIVNPIREQQRMIADIVSPIREQQRMIADIVNPIREQQRMIADIVNPIREQQRMIADIVNPIREQQRMIADIVNPIREQQRMIADIVSPIREQQRMIADIVNPIREQQRWIDAMMKPYPKEQRRITDQIMKNLPL